jgi:hypothetical protein
MKTGMYIKLTDHEYRQWNTVLDWTQEQQETSVSEDRNDCNYGEVGDRIGQHSIA